MTAPIPLATAVDAAGRAVALIVTDEHPDGAVVYEADGAVAVGPEAWRGVVYAGAAPTERTWATQALTAAGYSDVAATEPDGDEEEAPDGAVK